MKKFRIIVMLVGICLLTITCKKEHVPSNILATPVFYFEGLVGGTSFKLDAGVSGYYMYSSYTLDSNNVYNFIGNLKQTTSNLNSIEVILNNYKVSSPNTSSQPDSAFKPGNYSYYSVGVTDTVYEVQFTSSYTNGTAQTYSWNFGDGTTSASANPLHLYASKGTYTVCLTINGSAGSSSICNTINTASSTNAIKKAVVSSTSLGDSIFFNASTSFTAIRFLWDFGDGNSTADTLNGPIDNTSHLYSNTGLYHITLTAVDSTTNAYITTNYNAATANDSAGVANFTSSVANPVITTGSPLRLSNVIINWTDATGVVYTTNNNAPQPSGSNFTIISEEAYQNNINGQLTRKLKVSFTCTVYNTGHAPILIKSTESIIAVAYK